MTISDQTLHDFVLNLLNDATARSAFAEDPAHALSCAGLSDITAQDVQEVAPLVMDYADGSQLPGLGELPAGGEGLAGAIEQLRSVADTAGEERSAQDLGGFNLVASGAGEGFTGAASYVGEQFEGWGTVAASPESAAGAFAAANDDAAFAASGAGGLDGFTGGFSGATDAAAGKAESAISAEGAHFGSASESELTGVFNAEGGVGMESSGGALGFDNELGHGFGTLEASPDGGTSRFAFASEHGSANAFSGVSSEGAAGGFALGNDDLTVESSAAGTTEAYVAGGSLATAAGTYGFELNGDPRTPSIPEIEPTGDLAENLDSDALGRGGESAASTLATFVSDSSHFGVPAVPELGSLPVDAPDARSLPVDAPANLPADLPAELPADVPAELPDPASVVPNVHTLPAELPADVPAELPADLPADLPGAVSDLPGAVSDLPVANPLPAAPQDLPGAGEVRDGLENNPVTDAIGSSPVGGLTDAADAVELPASPGLGELGLPE